eukprot:TRINITY_DN11012_c0_g2_i2.p1 TRINITY_DN11012_c0_g2~~TRINITY_DN11012_c0_g2_i2.p1  ORF type:complete len:136 (+),score=17.46 TRINITY_DN11012_c0_g2_i2:62-409(+)
MCIRDSLNGTENANGVTYFGDGAWGVAVKEKCWTTDSETWLASVGRVNHVWLIRAKADQIKFQAVSYRNEVVDEYVEALIPSESIKSQSVIEMIMNHHFCTRLFLIILFSYYLIL